MSSIPPRLLLPLLLGTAVLAPWPTWATDPNGDAALWHDLGGVPRTITLGDYRFEVEERVVEDPEMDRWIPAIVPSPQAEAVAWLYRSVNGAKVRYERFLGAERIGFERSLAFRLGTEPFDQDQVNGIIGQVYDTDFDGHLSRRELERGNAAMERFFTARVRATVAPGTGFWMLPALPTATDFANAWLDHEVLMTAEHPWDCPDCAGVPHLDKLAALVAFIQEYAPPMEGAHTQHFVPGYNEISITVGTHPDRTSTLRLDDADGRTYWDMGSLPHSDAALDGQVDLVTADEAFPGASYNEVNARWERWDPGAGNQWMYEVLVDLAHAYLPRQLQVAEALDLAPEFEVPPWFVDELDARFVSGSPADMFGFDDQPESTPPTQQFQ
jgi:hypothetical protein